MLGSGSDQVVMRLSESNNLTPISEGLTPSIALKFLVDGVHSKNILGMSSFMNSQSWNFLEPTLSNRVKPFDVNDEVQSIMDQTLRKKMVEGSKTPFALGISHVASFETTGEELLDENVRVPYGLEFVSPLKDAFSSEK